MANGKYVSTYTGAQVDAGLAVAQAIKAKSGIIKCDGAGVISAAEPGTDFQAAISASGILKGDGSGGTSAATAGTDYVAPGTAATMSAQFNAQSSAAIGTAQVRNISAGTTDLTAGTSELATGTIYLVYEA